MKEERLKKIGSGLSVTLVGMAITHVIGFLFHPILVRELGVSEYGQLASVLAVFSVVSILSVSGINFSLRKFLPDSDRIRSEIASLGIGLLFITGVLTVIFAFTLGNVLLNLDIIDESYLNLFILSLPAYLSFNIFKGVRASLLGIYKEGYSEATRVIKQSLYYLGGIGAVIIGAGAEGVLAWLFLSSLIASIIGIRVITWEESQNLGKMQSINFSPGKFIKGWKSTGKEIVSFGSIMTLSVVATHLHLKADVIILSYYTNEASTGIYNGLAVLMAFLWIVPTAFQKIMLHNVSDIVSNKEERLSKIFDTVMSHTFCLLSVILIALFTLADIVLGLYYGPQFVNRILTFQILLIGSTLYGVSKIFTSFLEGGGLAKWSATASFLAVVLNLALNLLLIPKHGMLGAAIATSISYSSLPLMYAYIYGTKLEGKPLKDLKWIKVVFISFVSLLLLLRTGKVIENSVIEVLVTLASLSIVYIVLLYFSGLLNVKSTVRAIEILRSEINMKI